MIPPIKKTTDHLIRLKRAFNSGERSVYSREDYVAEDIAFIEAAESYKDLGTCWEAWFNMISSHSYQAEYIEKAFLAQKIITPKDCEALRQMAEPSNFKAWVRPLEYLALMDDLYWRQVTIDDDDLLNILDI